MLLWSSESKLYRTMAKQADLGGAEVSIAGELT
jgi:hypothetical protein